MIYYAFAIFQTSECLKLAQGEDSQVYCVKLINNQSDNNITMGKYHTQIVQREQLSYKDEDSIKRVIKIYI